MDGDNEEKSTASGSSSSTIPVDTQQQDQNQAQDTVSLSGAELIQEVSQAEPKDEFPGIHWGSRPNRTKRNRPKSASALEQNEKKKSIITKKKMPSQSKKYIEKQTRLHSRERCGI